MRTYLATIFTVFIITSLIAQSNNCACCTEKHQEFDFWVGEWTVIQPNGTPAGKNTLIKIQDHCILQENWVSATPGYTGTSNSFYNAKTKQWEQIWVDNQGQTLHLKGNRTGNQMILKTSVEINADGKPFFHRVTWTANKDGTVRQLWETITNNDKITIAFDGLYKKVNKD